MLAACTEEIETYSGESGIYFAMSATKGGLDDSKQDYTAETQIPFAVYSTISDTTLMVRAKVIGPAVGHDRKVTVQVVAPEDAEQAKEGWDYDALDNSYTVKAGEVYVLIPIHFYLRDDLEGKERQLKLELVANEDFATPMAQWLAPTALTRPESTCCTTPLPSATSGYSCQVSAPTSSAPIPRRNAS